MVSKAFEIDLGRIQKRAMDAIEVKAEQDRQAEQARVDAEAARRDAIRAKQTELNVALGAAGLPLIAVDGFDGPETQQAVIDVAALDDGPDGDDGPIQTENIYGDDGVQVLDQTTGDMIWIDGSLSQNRIDTEQTTDIFGQPYLVYSTSDEYPAGRYHNNLNFYTMVFDKDKRPEYILDPNNPNTYIKNPDYIGSTTGGGKPEKPVTGGDDDGGKGAAWDEHLRTLSAKGSITAYFKSFGLENISEWAYAQLASGYDVETVLMQMRYGSSATTDSDMYVPEIVRTTYDKKFPAMALRDADDKTAPLTEAEYIDLEAGYWQIIDAAGMGAYADAAIKNGLDLISDLIVGDVSLAEFQGRIGEAEEMAFNTNLEVQAALQDNWGWGKGEFITAMFDPDSITLKDAKRRRRSSMLSGTAHRALGGTAGGSELAFSKQLGLDLLGLNIQDREVQAQMAPLTGLTGSTLHSDALSADQLGEGVWGSGKARAALRQEVGGRTAGFRGKSGGLTTEAGIRSYGSAGT